MVIHNDSHRFVLNKPPGLATQGGTKTHHHLDRLLDGLEDDSGARTKLVHRLDKDTSGLIAVAKTDRARASLVAQWEGRTVRKGYVALSTGFVEPDEGTIDAPIGRDPAQRQRMAVIRTGRPAVTHFTVAERFAGASLLDVEI
ncbi:MAG: RluA family pseudouridine synthase, partial [Actinobacteria bacterium]|nr:RluA family pseudouridine synthase [Actinomycetota bacterium]